MTSAVVPSEPRSPSGRLAKPGGSRVGHVRRYGEIVRILVKHGFVDVVDALHLRAYLTAGRRVLSALGHDGHPDPTRAVRLRLAFEELGPTFIKFGQALSTHSDLLPAEVIAELTRLQDTVPPLQPGVAEKAIEDALGCGITDVHYRSRRPSARPNLQDRRACDAVRPVQKYTPEALALRTAKAGRDVLSGLRTLPANLAEITRKIPADGMQVQFVHRNLDFIRPRDGSVEQPSQFRSRHCGDRHWVVDHRACVGGSAGLRLSAAIAIDPITTMKIEDVLVEMKQRMTILIATNLVQQAHRVADQVLFLNAGRLVEAGSNDTVFSEQPASRVTFDYVRGRFG